MIRKMLCVMCAAVLALLSGSALAAPVRDTGRMDIGSDEGLRGFLSTVMSAAMLKDLDTLSEGDAPSQGLTEAVMAVFEYNMFGLDSVTLTEADCAGLYRGFFAAGTFEMPSEGDCPCVRIVDGKMVMDLAELNETPLVGAHVHEAVFEGGRVRLKADLYTAWGYYMTSPEDIPEEDLTWYAGAEICAEANEGELFGWRLVSYRMTGAWQDGALSEWRDWENAEEGYALRIPSRFGESGTEKGDRQWQTPDGTASLGVRVLPAMTFAEGLEMMASEEGTVKAQEEFSCIMAAGETCSRVLVCAPDSAYLVTLSYPAENAAEYTFYAEIIRNSLTVRGLADG